MRALVIDDSRTVRKILSSILEQCGFQVDQAENGRVALDRLREIGRVELSLVDWNMPEMNGLEFVEAARQDPALEGMRIVVVTTETESAQMERALDAGADDYVMKPFTKDVILEKLSLMGLGS